jgi:hypothetical protein
MKKSAALIPSKGWLPFLVVVVPCMWVLTFRYRDWPLAIITVLISIYLVVDAWNLVRIRRADPKEPKSVKKALKK